MLTSQSVRLLYDSLVIARHICHAPLTMGTLLVSAGAAVITPQRRFTRAPQGSPKSLGGREEVSLFPHAVTASRNAAFGFQAGVDRSKQSCPSPPGAVHLRGAPDSLVHGLCTDNAVYSVVKLHEGTDPLTYFPVGRVVLVYDFPMFSKSFFNFWSSLTLRWCRAVLEIPSSILTFRSDLSSK